MCTLIWLMVGIILLTITIFVHKHTYERECGGKLGDKLPFPMWMMLSFVVLAAIPLVNIIAFIVGALVYGLQYDEYDGILFHCESRWWKSFTGFLTREV